MGVGVGPWAGMGGSEAEAMALSRELGPFCEGDPSNALHASLLHSLSDKLNHGQARDGPSDLLLDHATTSLCVIYFAA